MEKVMEFGLERGNSAANVIGNVTVTLRRPRGCEGSEGCNCRCTLAA